MTTAMKPKERIQQAENTRGAFLFLGISLIVLGCIAMVGTVFFTIGGVILFAGIMLSAGVMECIHAFQMSRGRDKLMHGISSLVYLATGGMIIWNPLLGALSLTLAIAAFLIVAGIIRIAYGIQKRTEDKNWGWFAFGGAMNLLLGGLIAMGWPASALWVIGLFIGLEMLLHGFALIAIANASRDFESLPL